MENITLLDRILSTACSNPSLEVSGYNSYLIELHCTMWEIVAKVNGQVRDDAGEYLYSTFSIHSAEQTGL